MKKTASAHWHKAILKPVKALFSTQSGALKETPTAQIRVLRDAPGNQILKELVAQPMRAVFSMGLPFAGPKRIPPRTAMIPRGDCNAGKAE